ncbi:hypothetical protein [Dialister invisus]|uniref:hypothetical protein n=1 Tax=Dialister invisus TaxID=218538 RepID=UPI003995F649
MVKVMKARIAYTGPALENGEMDVRDLAPSLIAFADLVENVNHVIGGEKEIKVLVNQDSIKKGSFDITFLLNTNILEEAAVLVGMAQQNGLADLLTILGWAQSMGSAGVITGIFPLIKRIGYRTIDGIKKIKDKKAEITLSDGDKITTKQNTVNVLLNVDCRVSIEKIIQPVKKNAGIDGFELRNPDEQGKDAIERVTKSEATMFDAPPAEDFVEEDNNSIEQELTVKIVTANFDDGKWRLTDGTNTFWANIEDDEFIRKVENNELRFGKGDMLTVRYFIKQCIKNGHLSSDYIVSKVLAIRRKPEQIKLPFEYK